VTEQRKASDVLLDLETKIDKLISLTEAQNLNARILSNKLNDVMTALSKQSAVVAKPTVEAVNVVPAIMTSPLQKFQPLDPERQIPIYSETRLPETNSPQGFRRTARPETFAGEDKTAEPVAPKFPVQLPKGAPPPGRGPMSEVTAPMPPVKAAPQQKPANKTLKSPLVQNAIPVYQRIVDKNGKSIFLADVEVTDLSSGQPIHKTRTNGTGKWMASLGVGAYRVVIRKRENSTADKSALEAIQDIQVDGQHSPLELQTLIIK